MSAAVADASRCALHRGLAAAVLAVTFGCGDAQQDSRPDGDHAHGTPYALGRAVLGGVTFAVTWNGEPTVGAECSVNLEILAGLDKVRALRAWVGDETGEGTLRRKLDGVEHLHQHFLIPDGLPPRSRLWITLETKDGDEALRCSFELPGV